MTAISNEAVVDPAQTRGTLDRREVSCYSAILAVHTTLANPFVIAVLVLMIAGAFLLRRRRRG